MTLTNNTMRSAILASALLGQPVLAQDRVAVFVGSGEGAEVMYVAPGDPRARSATGNVADLKAPLIATWEGQGESGGVAYFEATSARTNVTPSAFGVMPLSGQQQTRRIATYVGSGESAEVVYTEVPVD
ncbi:hypothetical protein [Neoroseomonas lacus]|uniref:Uncharacterized protein n=1 Tax=Neoroseomonas lacus TaxID=287609 RepID=A0A917K5I5_9PROT|nr:hypothetical protein [Neoroseomonas lacus]GGJ01811.1 hypothetical protein GCM10011320_05810 [Neoroseomonas lacus]